MPVSGIQKPLIAKKLINGETIWDKKEAFQILNYSWKNRAFTKKDIEDAFPSISNLKGLFEELKENRIVIPFQDNPQKMSALQKHIGENAFLEKFTGKYYETIPYYFNYPRLFLRAFSLLGFNVDNKKEESKNNPISLFGSKNFDKVIITEYLSMKQVFLGNQNNPIEMETTKNELFYSSFPIISRILYHYLESDYSLSLKNNFEIRKTGLTDLEGFLKIMPNNLGIGVKRVATELFQERIKNIEKNISIDSYILQFPNYFLINFPEIIKVVNENSKTELNQFREYLFSRHERFSPQKFNETTQLIETMPD